jgi:hypothetical protein
MSSEASVGFRRQRRTSDLVCLYWLRSLFTVCIAGISVLQDFVSRVFQCGANVDFRDRTPCSSCMIRLLDCYLRVSSAVTEAGTHDA